MNGSEHLALGARGVQLDRDLVRHLRNNPCASGDARTLSAHRVHWTEGAHRVCEHGLDIPDRNLEALVCVEAAKLLRELGVSAWGPRLELVGEIIEDPLRLFVVVATVQRGGRGSILRRRSGGSEWWTQPVAQPGTGGRGYQCGYRRLMQKGMQAQRTDPQASPESPVCRSAQPCRSQAEPTAKPARSQSAAARARRSA